MKLTGEKNFSEIMVPNDRELNGDQFFPQSTYMKSVSIKSYSRFSVLKKSKNSSRYVRLNEFLNVLEYIYVLEYIFDL